MVRTSLLLRSLLLPALLLGAACGDDPADPAAVRARLETTLPGLVEHGGRSLTYLGESESLTAMGDSLASLDASLALPFSVAGPFASSDEPLPAEGETGEPDGAALAQQLADALFNDANHEGDGVYRVPADLLCPEDFETGAPDPACLDAATAAELRVRVELAGDGLDFTLLVGPDRDEPLALELRSDRLTVAVDLAEARSAIAFLGSLSGDAALELPDVMEGEVALSLIVLGEAHASIEVAVRRAVRVEGQTADGRIAFATAAKDPAFAIEVDAIARSIGATVDVGATSLIAPWASMNPGSLATGTYALSLGGFSGRVDVADGDQTITIEDVGLGDATTTVKLDEFTLIAVDLNAAAGRRLAITIAPGEDGLPTFALAPGLDLEVAVDFSPLRAAGDLVEDFLIDQTYRVVFGGDAPVAAPRPASLDGSSAGGLAILAGELTISSTAASAPVVVAAGQCLVGDAVSEGEHPILGALAAGSCP